MAYSLEIFDKKVSYLKEWCEQYELENNTPASVRIILNAKLPGFKSRSEVERILTYIRETEDEKE